MEMNTESNGGDLYLDWSCIHKGPLDSEVANGLTVCRYSDNLKVRHGGYDHKVNETVNVVTAKTTEIGHKTWGLLKGVMAFASQKVEELAKDNPNWNLEKKKGWNNNGTSSPAPSSGVNGNSVSSSGKKFNSVASGSWDDWDNDGNRNHASTTATAPTNGNDWAGWDDVKDDGHNSFYKSDGKATTGKSDRNWSGAGFL